MEVARSDAVIWVLKAGVVLRRCPSWQRQGLDDGWHKQLLKLGDQEGVAKVGGH